jgi:hypothetical protein
MLWFSRKGDGRGNLWHLQKSRRGKPLAELTLETKPVSGDRAVGQETAADYAPAR